jgi:hypothetical protein
MGNRKAIAEITDEMVSELTAFLDNQLPQIEIDDEDSHEWSSYIRLEDGSVIEVSLNVAMERFKP